MLKRNRTDGIGAAVLPRRGLLLSALALFLSPRAARSAQGVHFFRIGAGPSGGTWFPAAGWIATAISNPPGSRPCEKNGRCGVPGLIAMAQTTDGGAANIEALRAGGVEAALAYADMAHDAGRGRGAFKSRGPFAGLRAVAMLAPECLHLVVGRESAIPSVSGLKGRRIAVAAGAEGLAEILLKRQGFGGRQIRGLTLPPEAAAAAFAAGRADAVVCMARPGSRLLHQIVSEAGGVLLAPGESVLAEMMRRNPFLVVTGLAVPGGKGTVESVALTPVLLVRESLDDALVEQMSRALWLAARADDGNSPLDAQSFAPAQISRRGVPLHPAAQRFRDQLNLTD